MARAFHDVTRGLNLDESVQIIGTNGPPAGGDADAVVVGSLAIDFANGHLYQKNEAGSGLEKWQFIGADKSFREPALVRENIVTTLPTATPATNDTQDGETITDGDRVLFSALTVLPNVYIYDFTTGTYSEDTNEATTGDTVFIQTGTDAGKSFTFNGTAWVQTDQASIDELGFIHDFIGKTGFGAETPTYSSTNVVTQSTDLESAIGELDAAAANSNVGTTLGAVSGTNTLDSVLVDVVAAVKWLVVCRQGTAMKALEIWASHDGTTGADAVDTDDTEYARIKKNAAIAGFSVAVDLSGAGAAQVMRLQVTSTAAADWQATRVPVNF
jgi:hypothetical protein